MHRDASRWYHVIYLSQICPWRFLGQSQLSQDARQGCEYLLQGKRGDGARTIINLVHDMSFFPIIIIILIIIIVLFNLSSDETLWLSPINSRPECHHKIIIIIIIIGGKRNLSCLDTDMTAARPVLDETKSDNQDLRRLCCRIVRVLDTTKGPIRCYFNRHARKLELIVQLVAKWRKHRR